MVGGATAPAAALPGDVWLAQNGTFYTYGGNGWAASPDAPPPVGATGTACLTEGGDRITNLYIFTCGGGLID